MTNPEGLPAPGMRPTDLGLRDTLLVAAWCASAGGLGTTALLAASSQLLGRYVHSQPEVVWMGALSNAFLFLPILLGVLVFRGAIPLLRSAQFVITGFTSLMFFGWGLGYPRLAQWASLILALGLAFQAGRIVAPRWASLRRPAMAVLGVMLAAELAGGLGLAGWRLLAERRAVAALPAADAGRPNVLLLVLDTVRAMSLSLYGYPGPTTPWLTTYASTGLRFDHAISTAPWTLPSHASMLTGRWAQELTADWERPLDRTYPTLAEELAKHGYVTGGFVANTYYCSRESGLARGFSHYADFRDLSWDIVRVTPLGRLVVDSHWFRGMAGQRHKLGRKSADDINRQFLGWLDRHGSRPFFAFLNYFDAHGPYQPVPPYDSLFSVPHRLINPDLDAKPDTWTTEAVQGQFAAYHASIAGLDERLGNLIAELARRGALDNTLVIITADHGEEFLEHGVMSHGNSLYRQAVHVPLVMVFPGRLPSGAVVGAPVSLRDIPATVMELAGFHGEHDFPGEPLTRFTTLADSGSASPDVVYSFVDRARGLPGSYPVSTGPLVSVIVDGFRFVEALGQRGFWFRVADDAERDSLAATEIPGEVRTRSTEAINELHLPPRDRRDHGGSIGATP